MNSDFSDELLSGLLDGELSPSERQRVEQHLARHPADRQLLDELRALRADLQRLPPVTVPPDFAERVVQAALAAQAPMPVPRQAMAGASRLARWAMLAAGVAAALLVGLWLKGRFGLPPRGRDVAGQPLAGTSGRNPAKTPVVPGSSRPPSSPAPDMADALRQALAATRSDEALVVRLRVGSDFPSGAQLDAALSQSGLALRPPSDVSTGASALAPVWRQRVQQRLKNAGSPQADAASALAIPSDALWIEGSAEEVETLLYQLQQQSATVFVAPETRLVVRPRPTEVGEAEGEPGQVRGKTPPELPAAGPLAQHLPPTLFPLPREPLPAELGPSSSQVGGRRRVLLLIERVD